MARIEDSRGREDDNSGYARLFGNAKLGQLLSRVHATVIRNGHELETMLAERCPFRAVGLRDRLSGALPLFPQAVEVYFGEALPLRQTNHQTVADVVVVDHVQRSVRVIEIKDGDVFDTKKADGELAALVPLATWLAQQFGYRPAYHLCCFNQDDRQAIVRGLKGRFAAEHVMTGREVCELLGVDYDAIRARREADVHANLAYLARELADIPELAPVLAAELGLSCHTTTGGP